ncbi:MliC family protein [Accumulibacter sp.]|uniref:MliC family protein n=1 Tax=Accumulibacter sp. TaxID=2053492 RepID=UPI0025CDCE75|nr:MliC family protein [Accumulibacter sp.]MCM8593959.1 MliC family protein [Accumulibacter sp.]MCM8627808.1 MliC family protein [Accumulibacter sp.]MDS4048100.1 MliC family protein [Accumulibacter sp.]
MTGHRLSAAILASAFLAACATAGSPDGREVSGDRSSEARQKRQKQLSFRLGSGLYRCELGQTVDVRRVSETPGQIEIGWQGNRHTLQREASASGLPRYEDGRVGLLWIDLPWKSVLMDTNTGRPLANECKLARERAADG